MKLPTGMIDRLRTIAEELLEEADELEIGKRTVLWDGRDISSAAQAMTTDRLYTLTELIHSHDAQMSPKKLGR